MATTREIPLRVLYTINSSPQYILARCTKAKVTPVQDSYATCSLKDCLAAISRSSPELAPSATRDYSVYVMDPLEVSPDAVSVAVGLGYMSRALQCKRKEDDVQVCGTIKKTPRGDNLEVLFALRETEVASPDTEMQPQASTSRTLRKRASKSATAASSSSSKRTQLHPIGYAAANSPQAVELEKLMIVKMEPNKSALRQQNPPPTTKSAGKSIRAADKKKQRAAQPDGALDDALLAAINAIDTTTPQVNENTAQKQNDVLVAALRGLLEATYNNRVTPQTLNQDFVTSPSPAPSESPARPEESEQTNATTIPQNLPPDKENVGPPRPTKSSNNPLDKETSDQPAERLKRKREMEEHHQPRPRILAPDFASQIPKFGLPAPDLMTRKLFPAAAELKPVIPALNRSVSAASADVKPTMPFGPYISVALSSPIRGADTSFVPDASHRFTVPPRPTPLAMSSKHASVNVKRSGHSPVRGSDSDFDQGPTRSFVRANDPSRVPDRVMGRCYSLPVWAQTGTALRPRLSEEAVARMKADEEERDRIRKEKDKARRETSEWKGKRRKDKKFEPLLQQQIQESTDNEDSFASGSLPPVDESEEASGSDLPILASDFDFELDFASSQSTCPQTPPPRRSARIQSISATPGSRRSQRSHLFTPGSARSEKSLFDGSPVFSPSPAKGRKQSHASLSTPYDDPFNGAGSSNMQQLSPSPPKRTPQKWKGKGRAVTFEQRDDDELPVASSDSEIPSTAGSDETARPHDDDDSGGNGVFWGLPPSSPPPPSSPILPPQSLDDEQQSYQETEHIPTPQATFEYPPFAGFEGPDLSPDNFSSTSEGTMSLKDFTRLFSSDSGQTHSSISDFSDFDFVTDLNLDALSKAEERNENGGQAPTPDTSSQFFDFELGGFWDTVQPLVDGQVNTDGEVDAEKLAREVQDLFGGCLM